MSAPHLLAPSVDGDTVKITGDDAHHAVRVLRLREGERVTVSDGEGNVVNGVVIGASKNLTVEVLGRTKVERAVPQLRVAQAIPKGPKFDQIVKELTEVGVDEIVPLRTLRSIARWDGADRVERLRAIARGAAKQSHRAWLPTVSDPLVIGDVISDGLAIVLHEEAHVRLSTVLPGEPPSKITLFIGPEGGFADEEIDVLTAGGVVAASLGPLILRTEAAGLVAAALVRGRYGLIG